MKIRRIGTSKHKSAQFMEISLFLLEESDKRQKVYVSMRCELQLVEDFRANILIGNDIFASESFMVDVGLGHTLVGSCGVKITIKARQIDQFLQGRLLAEKDEVIPPRSETMIPLLLLSLPNDGDFSFHPTV